MESAFQFTNPALSGLEFWINKNFNGEKDTKIQIRMNMSVKVAKKAPSLLLSYLRPIVAQVTSASKYGTYNIPFVNFTKPMN